MGGFALLCGYDQHFYLFLTTGLYLVYQGLNTFGAKIKQMLHGKIFFHDDHNLDEIEAVEPRRRLSITGLRQIKLTESESQVIRLSTAGISGRHKRKLVEGVLSVVMKIRKRRTKLLDDRDQEVSKFLGLGLKIDEDSIQMSQSEISENMDKFNSRYDEGMIDRFDGIETEHNLLTEKSDRNMKQGHSPENEVMDLEEENGDEDTMTYNPLAWPDKGRDKLLYILLFPINLVFFFLFPNIAEKTNFSKFATSFIIQLLCTGGLTFLLVIMNYTLIGQLRWTSQFVGLLNGMIFVFPYSFFQTGTSKISFSRYQQSITTSRGRNTWSISLANRS